ncbi:MAG: PEGA domain-containing protein [Acidobacteria bacterium]|nr:PEGA domain-containing protein [Acidobacteriota bacterium]
MKKTLAALFILALVGPSLLAGTRIIVRHPHYRGAYWPTPTTVVKIQPNTGVIDINCNQKEALVYVNGKYAGTAGQYDGFPGKLTLKQGQYRIKLVYGDKVEQTDVFVAINAEVNLNVTF